MLGHPLGLQFRRSGIPRYYPKSSLGAKLCTPIRYLLWSTNDHQPTFLTASQATEVKPLTLSHTTAIEVMRRRKSQHFASGHPRSLPRIGLANGATPVCSELQRERRLLAGTGKSAAGLGDGSGRNAM